jgi:type II secretory pathway pseudopilin PulG
MRGPSRRSRSPASAAGFTYIGLLIAVVVLGIALSAVGTVWRTQAQREREQELIFIGHEFRAAITAYSRATGNGGGQFPQDINDLIEDKRGPEPRHYLRRLYADPMTGAQDWTILQADSLGIPGRTGIVGIASSSKAVPLKKAGFSAGEEAFADATCYCDWKFVYAPRIARRRHNPVQQAAD